MGLPVGEGVILEHTLCGGRSFHRQTDFRHGTVLVCGYWNGSRAIKLAKMDMMQKFVG